MKAHKILITMTAEDGGVYADAARTAGFEPILESMLEIEHLDFDPPDMDSGTPLIFTSSHALRAFAQKEQGRDYPLYVVGRSTAELARNLGFTSIDTAVGNVDDLANLLLQRTKTGLISPIYVRGEVVSADLAQILMKNGLIVREIITYKALGAEKLSLNLLNALDNREIYGVMLFSARGGQVFADLIEQYNRAVRLKNTKVLCISDAVVQSVSVLPFQQSFVAKDPDRHGMMKLLEDISVSGHSH